MKLREVICSCTGVNRSKRDMYSSSIVGRGYIESLEITDVTLVGCGGSILLCAGLLKKGKLLTHASG